MHQTGAANLEAVKVAAAARQLDTSQYIPRGYFTNDEIAFAYRAVDLIVCRCGISTLAEATACGIPSLLVPLPTAYADHQTANARAIERSGGGLVLAQAELTGETLARTVQELRSDPGRLSAMAQSAARISVPDAAERVARLSVRVTEVT
jgi:UDP-N-acetylglucosamine--N-acetylmuramyl-(pentapeptide) pyrophosphoryl-undecaprenol N-acetylglucosamine transferase